MLIDLHTHTTASDGLLSPAGLVRLAAECGVSVLGISDHDTVNGIDEATEAARPLGIRVVPSVEINSYIEGAEFHILGYFIDHARVPLRTALAALRESRIERMHVIIARLAALGIRLTGEEVLSFSRGGTVGRPHIAQALVKNGSVGSIREAFDTLIGEGRPAYAPRSKLTPRQAIDMIREAGGVPVLAHPGLWGADAYIPQLAEAGILGLEVYSPDNSASQTARYLETARSLGLCATGGSDFHGWHESGRPLGATPTPPGEFERLESLSASLAAGAAGPSGGGRT